MNPSVPNFNDAHVLVIGDAMLDRYWHGSSSRVSPEAPVPVVDITDVEDRPGGAANVALNLASLGARCSLLAMVGQDEAGHVLRAKLESAGIDCYMDSPQDYQTTTKLRIVSHNQQMIRADFESVTAMDEAFLVRHLKHLLPVVDVLLISDYDKGAVTHPETIILLAREAKVPVLVDPKFKDFSRYRGAFLLKPNRAEFARAVGDWNREDEMVTKGQQLIDDLELEALLVTRAEKGMTLLRPGAPEVHFPARTREVSDVSGAGDTVISVLSAAISAGQDLLDAVGLSNIAAGVTCARPGIVSISGPELRREVSMIGGYKKGIMTEEQLVIAVTDARERGERIVFTNGCFDILHAGHVDYLIEARMQGDKLIVAINDDDSVTRLKGEGRPLNQVDRRMTLLAGLASVDWVVSFPDDTPERLLEAIRPDVLVKGGDYRIEEVVGSQIVMNYGGTVKVVGLVEDCSTTRLVEKIRSGR